MARDLPEYFEKMDELQAKAAGVLRMGRKRQRNATEMQALADEQKNQDIALDGAQKAALLDNQLESTMALYAILDAAIAAIDPAQ